MYLTTTTKVFEPSLVRCVITVKGYSNENEKEFSSNQFYIVQSVEYEKLNIVNYRGEKYTIYLHELDDIEIDESEYEPGLEIEVILEDPQKDDLPF